MNDINYINYDDLLDILKKINNPFSRETFLAKVKSNLGEGNFIWYDMGSGIATSSNNYKLNNNTCAKIRSDVAGAILIFNLSNDIQQVFKDKREYLLKKNTYFLGFSSDKFEVDLSFKKDTSYNTLTIGIKEELFLKLSNKLENLNEKMIEAKENSYSILEGGDIDHEQMETLLYLKGKGLNEFLITDLYLESKITSLVHYTIEKIIHNVNSKLNLDKNIIRSLKKAKEIILTQYASSLSIKEIAYKSAINECYLKKDFKIYYKMTVYEILQKHRMKISKDLLKEDFSVKEVALKVGYKHTGNFSKLFSTYFGLTPSVYKKQFNK